jgi:hypothetical protein
MKNIHVLRTDKPSRLLKIEDRLNLDSTSLLTEFYKNFHKYKNQNIYITNDEKIKEGEYFIGANKIAYKFTSDDVKNVFKPKGKKIILTTDQDLIADGVQAINNEFLEWFVKNPSCEFIEVEKFHGIKTSVAEISAVSGNDDCNWKGRGDLRNYKIIIPKEEPIFINDEDFERASLEDYIEEPKQETIEESLSLEQLLSYYIDINVGKDFPTSLHSIVTNAYNNGADYQKERSYSEAEILNQLNYLMKMPSSELDKFTDENDNITRKWFEQFKKK